MAKTHVSNPHRKETRQQSYARGKERKDERRTAQENAAKQNRISGTSPWKEAKAARKERRAHPNRATVK